jgi:precorrin-4/cobalt-precorrin-4 C11-methyltransferase
MTKRLIGVGVGPGDPELVTVKAVRVLREADVVLVPVLAGPVSADPAGPGTAEPGRAETIIRAYVGADRVKRLEFALNDTGGVTPRRAAAWQAAAAAVAHEFAAGAATIAFGTLGDPNLYSTFSYLAQTVRDLVPEVTVQTVAGITAMQDLASRAGVSLAEGTEPVTLVPLNGGADALDQALACGGTVVGYKVGAAASPAPAVLRDRLRAAGRLDGAVIGARLGLDGEFIAPAAEILAPAAPATEAPAPPATEAPAPPATEAPAPPAQAPAPPATQAPAPPATEAPAPPAQAPVPPATQAPTSPVGNIPDIPYLSTLIAPALRPTSTGAALRPTAPEHANSNDVPLMSLERHQRNIDVVTSAPGARRGATAGETSADAANGGLVSFVGAGPGAPDLLTLRGAQAIAHADVVIWASSLVDQRVLAHAKQSAEIVDSAKLPMEGVLPYYERAAQQKLRIARVHSGDPSLWGAIAEQIERCQTLGLDTEIVPGVSSFTAVAARIGRELTIPEVAQSVILTRLGGGKTPMPPGEQVADFARHQTTMALFLSAARSGQLQDELLAGGYPPDTPCVVAYQVTWPDELIVRTVLKDLAATIKERKLWKHTLVLVGPGLAAGGSRSHLYHPGHFHGFRKADRQARKQLRETSRPRPADP